MLQLGQWIDLVKQRDNVQNLRRLDPQLQYVINDWDETGKTALMVAAGIRHNGANLQFLIERGADVKLISREKNIHGLLDSGYTALMIASKVRNNIQNLAILIDQGRAEVDHKDRKGNTALMIAARIQNNGVNLQYLLDRGANVNRVNGSGLTALMFASMIPQNIENLAILLQRGANIRATAYYSECGYTALVFASRIPYNIENIGFLLDQGADIHHANTIGNTAFTTAAMIPGNVENLGFLLDRGANIGHVTARFGKNTALTNAAHVPNNEMTLEFLLDRGANINHANADGNTALLLAAYVPDNIASIRLLLDRGANIESVNRYGYTAFIIASWIPNNIETLQLLMERGATIDSRALQKASSRRANRANVEWLLRHLPDPKRQDISQSTYLPLFQERRAMIQIGTGMRKGYLDATSLQEKRLVDRINQLPQQAYSTLNELFHLPHQTPKQKKIRDFMRTLYSSGLNEQNRRWIQAGLFQNDRRYNKYMDGIKEVLQDISTTLLTRTLTDQSRKRQLNREFSRYILGDDTTASSLKETKS